MTLFGPSKLTPVAATAALVMDKSDATVLVDFGSFIIKLPASPPHSTWSILAEGPKPYQALYKSATDTGFLLSLAVSCVNAAILNFANMFVVRDLGAIGVNIVAQLKGILIILGGVAMLGELVNLNQCAGYGIIVCGVFWFNNVEKKEKKHHEPQDPEKSETSCLTKA